MGAGDVLLASSPESGAEARVVLAEVLGLRTILLNLLFTIGQDEPVTAEGMQGLVECADKEKVRRALEKLGGLRAAELSAAVSEAEQAGEVGP
jgi:hypothetical protein